MNRRHVLIIGAPRSGSTWLQELMRNHHEITTTKGELTLFSRYIAPLVKEYEAELAAINMKGWTQGLPMLFDRQEIDNYVQKIIKEVYDRIDLSGKNVFLDKHPHYSEHVDLINHFLPESKFINLIRDGREVALSWHRVSKSEGFGASSFSKSCSDWKKFVLAAKNAEKLGAKRYLKIDYRGLINNPSAALKSIFEFCEVDSSDSVINEIIEATKNKQVGAPNKLIDPAKRKEEGFIGNNLLTPEQKYIFNLISGDLLINEGYEKDDQWAGSFWDRNLQRIKFKLRKSK